MLKRLVLCVMTICLFGVTPAQADTVPFAGWYLSAATGLGSGDAEIAAQRGDFHATLPLGKATGVTRSLTIGYTVPVERWRFGLSISGGPATLSGQTRLGSNRLGLITGVDIDRLGAVRAELGYVPRDDLFVYAFAGRAIARGTLSGDTYLDSRQLAVSRSGYALGTVTGLGVEYRLNTSSTHGLFAEVGEYRFDGTVRACRQQLCQPATFRTRQVVTSAGVRWRF